jgi:endonuclease/exonuclease/phosphatase family metal-dependent hydrolase
MEQAWPRANMGGMPSLRSVCFMGLVACGDSANPSDSSSSDATVSSSASMTVVTSGAGASGGDALTSSDSATASASASGGGSTGSQGGTNVGGLGGANVDGVGGSSGGVGGALVGGSHAGGNGGAGGAGNVGGEGGTGTRVRIATANLTTGNFQNYDAGEGIRLIQGTDPDILLVQEFNYLSNDAASFTAFATATCGSSCAVVRGPAAQIPNGIVSRYPVLSSGSEPDPGVTNRTLVWAQIDVPGSRDLWAMSVHFRTANPTARNAEAIAVLNFFQSNVPSGDLAVLGGDFNTDVRTEPAVMTLSAIFRTAAPYPADQSANANTNAPRTKPYDWILADGDLDAIEVPLLLGLNVFVGGAVIDSRVHTPLADIAPALQSDSGAASMQHMLVAKDYILQ